MEPTTRSNLKLFLWICLILFPTLSFCQAKTLRINDSTLILRLPFIPSQIEVDGENNLILLFPEISQINKYLYKYHYDSVLTIGGKSIREDGFLQPVKVSVYNRQLLFVLDEAQQRLSLLNKDLRVIRENQFALRSVLDDQIGEMYTISYSVSPSGEMFLLNQFDNKIYKINLFGELETSFGGLDFGQGSLYEPKDIQINAANQIFVSEPRAGQIKVYDLYGIFLYNIEPDKQKVAWENFHLADGLLFFWNKNRIMVMNLLKRETSLLELNTRLPVTDLYFQGQNLYLLLENEVHLYRINP